MKKLLAAILLFAASAQAQSAKEATFSMTTVAFGAVPATYATAVVTDTHAKRYVSIYSTLDQPIYVSFDGTNNHWYLGSNQAITPIVGEANLMMSRAIYIKKVSGAPGSGNVYITIGY